MNASTEKLPRKFLACYIKETSFFPTQWSCVGNTAVRTKLTVYKSGPRAFAVAESDEQQVDDQLWVVGLPVQAYEVEKQVEQVANQIGHVATPSARDATADEGGGGIGNPEHDHADANLWGKVVFLKWVEKKVIFF